MAAPAIVTCTASAWVKVATNVTSYTINRLINNVDYLHTYVLTGVAAPSDLSTAKRIFANEDREAFSNAAAVDAYIYVQGTVNGSVRVDT